eukprot:5372-Pleurochrysis_carterae.AAC.1
MNIRLPLTMRYVADSYRCVQLQGSMHTAYFQSIELDGQPAWLIVESTTKCSHHTRNSSSDIHILSKIVGALEPLIDVRSGALKARLCVQGCAHQVRGVDFAQTFCATMRPTSLRALAGIASSAGMRMRRRDFVASYLQGDLEQDEVIYCHPPPGYATMGEDGQSRTCRVEKLIYGMLAQAGRGWQRLLFPWLLDFGFTQCKSDPC